jgi:hypothetical protein
MASPTSVRQNPKQVFLKYQQDGSITTIPSSNNSNPLPFELGDHVQFISDSDVAVYLQLDPTKFSPSVFHPGIDSVEYIDATPKNQRKTVMHSCGYVKILNGVAIGYGWLPDHVKPAVADNTPSDGIYGVWTD